MCKASVRELFGTRTGTLTVTLGVLILCGAPGFAEEATREVQSQSADVMMSERLPEIWPAARRLKLAWRWEICGIFYLNKNRL